MLYTTEHDPTLEDDSSDVIQEADTEIQQLRDELVDIMVDMAENEKLQKTLLQDYTDMQTRYSEVKDRLEKLKQ